MCLIAPIPSALSLRDTFNKRGVAAVLDEAVSLARGFRFQRRHALDNLDEAIKLLSCTAKFGAYSGYILLMSLRQCADTVFYLYCVETIRSGEQVDVLLHRETEEEDVIRDRSFVTNLESGRTRNLSHLRGSRGFKPCSTWRHGIRKKEKSRNIKTRYPEAQKCPNRDRENSNESVTS